MPRHTKIEAFATRQKITEAAAQCFRVAGVSGTSLDMIATRAGFTRGAIYWHFKERQDLLDAVMLDAWRPLLDRLDLSIFKHGPVLARFRKCISLYLQDVENKTNLQNLLEISVCFSDYSGESSNLRNTQHERRSIFIAKVHEYLKHAAQNGEILNTIDLTNAAELISHAIAGSIQYQIWGNNHTRLHDQVMSQLETIFSLMQSQLEA